MWTSQTKLQHWQTTEWNKLSLCLVSHFLPISPHLFVCCRLCRYKPAKCHCTFPQKKHIVKVGGGPFSIATQVSFFASGPFPTCYQMSRSSSSGASKTGSLRAANVRKPNPAGGAGRFQLRRRRRMDRRRDGQTDRQRRCLLITWVLLSFKPSVFPPTSAFADETVSNFHFSSQDVPRVCVKFPW